MFKAPTRPRSSRAHLDPELRTDAVLEEILHPLRGRLRQAGTDDKRRPLQNLVADGVRHALGELSLRQTLKNKVRTAKVLRLQSYG